MVEGRTQVNRVHQGCSVPVFTVELVDAFAGYHKRGYLPVIKRYAR
jgi:hypothetical protein